MRWCRWLLGFGVVLAVLTATLVASGSGVVAAVAQQAKPTFEVASVKRNVSASGGWSQNFQPGGRFTAANVPLPELIQLAYGLRDFQLVGVSGWAQGARFDIAAKAEGEVPREQQRLMLQALLEDRFKLILRKEQREMPIYELVVDRSDGRLGSGMTRVPDGEKCGQLQNKPQTETPPRARVSRGCGPMAVVASTASSNLGATVVDKTGLSGVWDYSVYFTPDLAGDPDLPAFSTALREQLGVRVERARGLVDVFVIESIQQPTDN